MKARFGKKEFGFFPRSFILPQDIKQLRKAWEEGASKHKWIVKPVLSEFCRYCRRRREILVIDILLFLVFSLRLLVEWAFRSSTSGAKCHARDRSSCKSMWIIETGFQKRHVFLTVKWIVLLFLEVSSQALPHQWQ